MAVLDTHWPTRRSAMATSTDEPLPYGVTWPIFFTWKEWVHFQGCDWKSLRIACLPGITYASSGALVGLAAMQGASNAESQVMLTLSFTTMQVLVCILCVPVPTPGRCRLNCEGCLAGVTDAFSTQEAMLRLMSSAEGVSRSRLAPDIVLECQTLKALADARLMLHTYFPWAMGLASHVTGNVISRETPADVLIMEAGSPPAVCDSLELFSLD